MIAIIIIIIIKTIVYSISTEFVQQYRLIERIVFARTTAHSKTTPKSNHYSHSGTPTTFFYINNQQSCQPSNLLWFNLRMSVDVCVCVVDNITQHNTISDTNCNRAEYQSTDMSPIRIHIYIDRHINISHIVIMLTASLYHIHTYIVWQLITCLQLQFFSVHMEYTKRLEMLLYDDVAICLPFTGLRYKGYGISSGFFVQFAAGSYIVHNSDVLDARHKWTQHSPPVNCETALAQ